MRGIASTEVGSSFTTFSAWEAGRITVARRSCRRTPRSQGEVGFLHLGNAKGDRPVPSWCLSYRERSSLLVEMYAAVQRVLCQRNVLSFHSLQPVCLLCRIRWQSVETHSSTLLRRVRTSWIWPSAGSNTPVRFSIVGGDKFPLAPFFFGDTPKGGTMRLRWHL